jgi:hypothetical protein
MIKLPCFATYVFLAERRTAVGPHQVAPSILAPAFEKLIDRLDSVGWHDLTRRGYAFHRSRPIILMLLPKGAGSTLFFNYPDFFDEAH